MTDRCGYAGTCERSDAAFTSQRWFDRG
jgi:hypothetical protein